MRVAMISGQECLVDKVQQSARKAGLGLWFLDQQGRPDGNNDPLDAVAIFIGAAAQQDRSPRENSTHLGCTPFDCVSCEGAALCGGRTTIN